MLDTALDTGAIATLADCKEYLGLSTGSTDYDRRLRALINTVTYQFDSYTNRTLSPSCHTEYHDGDGSDELYLNQWPLVSTSTNIDVRIDVDRSYDTGDKVDSTSVIVYSTAGKVVLDDDTFDAGYQSVKVVYTAGYSTIPYDLEYAALEMVRVLFDREKSNSVGRRSESFEGAAVTYEPTMPWSVKDVLDKYRDHGKTSK